MFSTPEEITDYSPGLPVTQTIVNKPSTRKQLYLFTNIFDVKKITAIRRGVAAKSKRRANKAGCGLWTHKTKRKRHSKINEQIKRNIYTWITRHTQVVLSPISNDCLKVIFGYHK